MHVSWHENDKGSLRHVVQSLDPLIVEGFTVPSYCRAACESADSHARIDSPGEACLATDTAL